MRYFVAALFFISWVANAQDNISNFHRLILQNDQGDVLVVKIKDRDFWVTPGWYQTRDKSIEQGLRDLALTHGVTIKDIQLKGVFTLRDKEQKVLSLRHFYTAKVASGSVTLPDNIENAEWLPKDRAIATMTFPHIRLLMSPVMSQSQGVLSGDVMRYQENGQFKAKLLGPITHW